MIFKNIIKCDWNTQVLWNIRVEVFLLRTPGNDDEDDNDEFSVQLVQRNTEIQIERHRNMIFSHRFNLMSVKPVRMIQEKKQLKTLWDNPFLSPKLCYHI